MRNLPSLVSDLESMDIIDHLTATTPPLITPTDYESIIATSQREGRRAGVRCLIACLLRRSEIQKVFRSFLNILKEDYSHLFDLLDKTYESLKNKNNNESDFGALNKIPFCSSIVSETENPLTVTTPCQSISKDVDHSKMFLKGLGVSENDIIFNIISTICSHPIAVMNWKNLLNELIGCNTIDSIGIFMNSNNSHLQNNDSNMKDLEDFLWCTSNCRRGLFHFFSINIIRNLENRGSPLKRSYLVNVDTDENIKHIALVIVFCTILQNTLYQKIIIDQDHQILSQSIQSLSESVQKSCVASIIHTKLLPALQCLDLNALHGEIEQLAFQMLH
ncbi:hypothetical protein Smp_141430 [Schistosoma mansoni]|uniref:hypothetical protein n=1 Tax=Schistosoma mansoni TaxID=6183 RepID=UPI0001A644D3|nr:hypothetical protein Smp_141430 [Schistosoma mansoni]|eukprot:XP_018653222.1 hypothetical protein Smp_141430 [Schistosoma mansoni]